MAASAATTRKGRASALPFLLGAAEGSRPALLPKSRRRPCRTRASHVLRTASVPNPTVQLKARQDVVFYAGRPLRTSRFDRPNLPPERSPALRHPPFSFGGDRRLPPRPSAEVATQTLPNPRRSRPSSQLRAGSVPNPTAQLKVRQDVVFYAGRPLRTSRFDRPNLAPERGPALRHPPSAAGWQGGAAGHGGPVRASGTGSLPPRLLPVARPAPPSPLTAGGGFPRTRPDARASPGSPFMPR